MRRQNTLEVRDWGEKKSSLILAGCRGKAGGARPALFVTLLILGQQEKLHWHHPHTTGEGRWQFDCPTLGQNLQSFCLVFCDQFLDCTSRPNLIQVPGKKGYLLISGSGVIPLGETERIYPPVARERLLWDASGVFRIPGLLIILFGEQRGRWEISPNESLSKWFYFWQGWYIQGAKHSSNILSKLSAPLKPRDVSNWFPHKEDVSH